MITEWQIQGGTAKGYTVAMARRSACRGLSAPHVGAQITEQVDERLYKSNTATGCANMVLDEADLGVCDVPGKR
jgi:hypothetical protein